MGAGVTRYVYRNDKDGNLRAIRSDQVIPYKAGETLASLEERVTRDLYHLECEQGSQFRGVAEFNPTQLKRIWVDNREADAAFERRREQALERARGER
jgi:hypothetical protein